MKYKSVYLTTARQAGLTRVCYAGDSIKQAIMQAPYTSEVAPKVVQNFSRLTLYLVPKSVCARVERFDQLFDSDGKPRFNVFVQWRIDFFPS